VGYSFIVTATKCHGRKPLVRGWRREVWLADAPDRQKKVVTSCSLVSAFFSKSRDGGREVIAFGLFGSCVHANGG
jgi:hypothetical protein